MSSESVKNTISLTVITLIAGLLLGGVYEITKKPIERERKLAKEKAYKEVFADAKAFDEIDFDLEDVEKQLKEQGYDTTINEAMTVRDDNGEQIGYVLTVTNHEGYGGDIQFAMGVTKEGVTNGIAFLSISETAGLGMKAKDEEFKNQFVDKEVSSFVYTKNGATSKEEIDAISGATITTNAVTNGVNAGLYYISTLE